MKVVLQTGVKDCGVCCLLSIIRFYGGDVSKEFLREITNTTKNGVTAYGIIKAAELIGFNAVGMKGDLNKISKNNLPCIAHIVINKQYKHFVVIYSINYKSKKIVIMDPSKGKKTLSFARFNLSTTSYYIFLKPIKKLPIMITKNSILKFIFSHLKKEKTPIFLIMILILLYFLFHILLAFHFKYLMEYCIKYHYSKILLLLSIIIFVMYLLKEIGNYIKNILLTKLTHQLDSLLLFKSYKQILLLPYLYYKNRTTGEILQRFKDLTTVKNYIVNIICSSLIDIIGVIIFLIILFRINIKITLLIIFFSIFLILLILILNKYKKRLIKKFSLNQDQTNSYLIESLSNVDSLKSNHYEKKLFDIFSLKYKKLLESSYNLITLNNSISTIKNIVNAISTTIILGIGSYLIIKQKLELSNIIVYQSIFNYYITCLYSVLVILSDYSDYSVALERINDLFMNNTEKFTGSYYYLGYRLNKQIKFSNLSYFIQDKVLFKNLNLVINNAEKVLIIGKSGAGKSTLAKILMRYVNVDFGMVSINDIDINHYHLEMIRNNITYVSSNEYLYTNSLYYNITLGKEVDKDKFNYVTKITKVKDIINEKDLGYKIPVEENGFNFSNGEKQRIFLARSLLRNSDIYIFDEAFSQIDKKNRIIIINNIFKYLVNKTVIMISHNITDYNLFDKVFKLDNGKIYQKK